MPFDKKRYPPDWPAISDGIRARAVNQCECAGECGLHRTNPGPRRCVERNGQPAIWAKGKIVLTVAHLGAPRWTCPKCRGWLDYDKSSEPPECAHCAVEMKWLPGDPHDKLDCRDENLKAMCQRCHLRYDIAEHVKNARLSRERKMWKDQLELIPGTKHSPAK